MIGLTCNFRDIKPSNFSIGLGENAKNIYLYDFGLSRQYKGKIIIQIDSY